ncbi:MAG: type II toxin-antitoxin system death-on-curing family toxin [bacterium]
MALEFLRFDEVLAIHAHQVQRYGGRLGLRDRSLLESALAMPQAAFAGEELHASVVEKGAAYLFHLVKNHPFVDGNKRVGLAACLVFLRLNGIAISATDDALVELTVGVASSARSKADVTVFLAAQATTSTAPV